MRNCIKKEDLWVEIFLAMLLQIGFQSLYDETYIFGIKQKNNVLLMFDMAIFNSP